MNFENMMLRERSKSQNITYCRFPRIWNIQSGQIYTDRREILVAEDWRCESWGVVGSDCCQTQDFPLG